MDTFVLMKWRRGAKSTDLHGVGGGYVLAPIHTRFLVHVFNFFIFIKTIGAISLVPRFPSL